jgi:hypothetical protein
MITNLNHPQNALNQVALAGRHEPVFLPTSKPNQRFHQRWWTALPAIPATRDCHAYRRLWRQFADHTMNTFVVTDGLFAPRNRGFYVEGREDHLVPCFFENFALFPEFIWLERILSRLGIPFEGEIINARWGYSYSELLPTNEGRPHADIVMMWQDDRGRAVVAIETKKPGCGRSAVGAKDFPSNGHYLRYQKMRPIDRRYQALLVDDGDLRHLPEDVRNSSGVVTWQELIAIQRGAVERTTVSNEIRDLVLLRLDAHYDALGLFSDQTYSGSACAIRYEELRALNAPSCVKDWLVGSEVFFATRHPVSVVEPPHDWLAMEMTVCDYAKRKLQTTRDREQPIWAF